MSAIRSRSRSSPRFNLRELPDDMPMEIETRLRNVANALRTFKKGI